jgi:6-phosphogluconate dehydrogenase (decarboxylating)
VDLNGIAWAWRLGSVVVSLPLELCAAGLVEDPTLEGFAAKVSER